MKKKSSGARRASHLSRPNFEPRLRAYSTLSGAALVTALAAAASASAQITTITIGGTHSTTDIIPFGPPPPVTSGTFAFNLQHFSHPTTYGKFLLVDFARASVGTVQVAGGGTTSHVGPYAVNFADVSGGREAIKFSPNQPINGATNLQARGTLFRYLNRGQFATHGNVAHTVTGYVGFRLATAGQNYYGWLHVKVTGDGAGRPIGVDLVSDLDGVIGAYNATPGGPINAGQVSAIPEPASVATGLALFALGAVGVREHRRRRQLAA